MDIKYNSETSAIELPNNFYHRCDLEILTERAAGILESVGELGHIEKICFKFHKKTDSSPKFIISNNGDTKDVLLPNPKNRKNARVLSDILCLLATHAGVRLANDFYCAGAQGIKHRKDHRANRTIN